LLRNRNAMLSGNAAERRSRWDVGDEDEGLQPEPDSSYLFGAGMRVIGSEYKSQKRSVIVVCNLFVVRPFAW
jgi:hypothetical protein